MFEGIERLSLTRDWITLLLLFTLVLIAVLKFAFNERFIKLFSLSYSEKYFTNYVKSKPLIFNTFHLLFFGVIIFNISLLIFYTIKAYNLLEFANDFSFFLKISLVCTLYILIRYMVGYLLSLVFSLTEHQNYITLLKVSNLAYISVLVFPLLIFINYSSATFYKILITVSLIIALVLFGIRYYAVIKNIKLNFNSLFYLFLYLCALELAPILVVYKMFLD